MAAMSDYLENKIIDLENKINILLIDASSSNINFIGNYSV